MTTIDQARAFDFLIGEWRVRNHKLLSDGRWIHFDAAYRMQLALEGMATLDEYRLETPPSPLAPLVGMTLRLFHPETDEWSIRWVDTRTMQLDDPPLFGRFEGGEGTFTGRHVVNGRLTHVRYLWTAIDTGHPRWEQALRRSEQSRWATNWIWELDPLR